MKTIEIIGGGTVFHLRNHLALTAPAYGSTAQTLRKITSLTIPKRMELGEPPYNINLHLTKMASGGTSKLETNEDISNLLDKLIANKDTKIVFFNPALVDYEGHVEPKDHKKYYDPDAIAAAGKYQTRLKTSDGFQSVRLYPANKLVSKIRKNRKDIFLVAFKTTCGATEDEQFLAGLDLLKTASCNLVLANDTKTRKNMIITPEQARYCVTDNRVEVLQTLVDMALARANLTFTRSTIVDGESVYWESQEVPESLRTVVNHCIAQGAYKPFKGATVGHFAVKVSDDTFYTSKRKTDFNTLKKVGLVKIKSSGPDHVEAYGSKPSVGGMSQRIIFKDHPEMDCIVHFHCPPKAADGLSIKSQQYLECGSHECGKNTSNGLVEAAPGIKCVYLDKHGPNIVFNHSIDPRQVIEFINNNFDLKQATDGISRQQ